MKEYMLMALCGKDEPSGNMTEEQRAKAGQAMGQWMGSLQEKGQLVNPGAPLGMSGKRISNGVVTDMMGGEFNEIVTGYMIIKAKDEEEALEIAKASPMVSIQNITLDVREIKQMG